MKLTKTEKKWFNRVLYCLYLVLICEFALRIYLIHFADPHRFGLYASRTMLENRFGAPLLIPHKYLGYANNPEYQYGTDQHNSLGFRGVEILNPKPEGTLRVVCLGGSTTYSSGVEDYRQSYPFLLNEALKEKGFDAEVINAGVEGYSSMGSYINYLLKVEDLNPDVLIIYHAINDLNSRMVWPSEAYLPDESGSFSPSEPSGYNYLRKLSVVRVPLVYTGFAPPDASFENIVEMPETNFLPELRSQLMNSTYPTGIFESIPMDSMIKANKPIYFERNIDKLITLAKSNGTQVVLSTFVYSDEFPGYYPQLALGGFKKGIEEHNTIMRGLGSKHQMPVIDLENELSSEKEIFTDGIHFTLLGNEKRVSIIADHLVTILSQKND